jgi:plastocyanin
MRILCSLLLGGSFLASVALIGCCYNAADDAAADDVKPSVQLKAAKEAKEAAGAWGSIKGQIVYGGDVPDAKEISITKDEKECKDSLKGAALVDEEWVVNKKNKGVRWVFVWIAQPPGVKAKMPIHPDLAKPKDDKVLMDQPCCHFEPRCLAIREGQTWMAKNSSAIVHNIHYEGRENSGDNVIIPAGKDREIKDLAAEFGPITVKCDIHPWMKAWIRVFVHPYYTISDADGNFEIKDAPAGNFRIYIWHEAVGWLQKGTDKMGEPITIKAGETIDLGKVEAKP